MGDKKYKAFISYSHADEAWGEWLQRSLERFRPPRSLVRTLEASGRAARLAPVFRDREDLPVAGSLNSAIQAALADSEYQIVLCSPNAARSRWVNEEIKLFHRLHGPNRVFALIIGGEPNASDRAGQELEECFPPALRFALDAAGEPTSLRAEPLAADAREGGDGKRYAMLKVAAGMLGVGLDDLVQRDAQRRARAAWTITGISLAGTAAAAALAFYAAAKGNEATRMRGKAEALIEFMLTDLNDKLEPVGRLDILEAVVERAMSYYADQNPKTLDDDALARRAKAMMQLGTLDFRRNKFDKANRAYLSAEQASEELLRRSPRNPDRIFDHAQNVFYVGEAAFRMNDIPRAIAQGEEYLRLANKLVDISGGDQRSRLELAYATNYMGNAKFQQGLYEEAIPYYLESISARKSLLDEDPENAKLRIAYAYAMSWLAYAELERGDFHAVIEIIRRQLDTYGDLISGDAKNFTALDAVVTAQRRLAFAYLALGDLESAARENLAAVDTAELLIAHDPQNANWGVNAANIFRMESYLHSLAGRNDLALAAADKAIALISRVVTDDAPLFYHTALGMALTRRLAAIGNATSARADLSELNRLIDYSIGRDVREGALFVLDASSAIADIQQKAGNKEAALAASMKAIAAIAPIANTLSAPAKISLARLYSRIGDLENARRIIDTLGALEISHPEFTEIKNKIAMTADN